jgi:FXSXX-COOH protein
VDSQGDREPDLVDLVQIRLADLPQVGGSALQRSLRRVLNDADNPQDAFAGFDSAL